VADSGPDLAVPNFTPEFKWIPIELLEFDPQNPRFRSDIDGADTRAIFEFMIEDAGIIDLARSIASQGFFPGEPILVSPMPGTNKMLVVEGNRRLAATMLINDPSLAEQRRTTVDAAAALRGNRDFSKLPSLIFKSRESILEYLGYRHVTGIKEWSPLAKARYLQQKFDALVGSDDNEAFRVTARAIGSRADYVARLLTANALFEKIADEQYFGIAKLEESTIEFSLITSLLAYSNVVEYLGLDSSKDIAMPGLQVPKLEFLTRFVFERNGARATRLGESRNIGRLSEVLANDKARAALESGVSLGQASQMLGTGAEAFHTLLASALESLKLADQSAEGLQLEDRDVAALNEVQVIAEKLKSSTTNPTN
jgi:hypothetical protein